MLYIRLFIGIKTLLRVNFPGVFIRKFGFDVFHISLFSMSVAHLMLVMGNDGWRETTS